jgi:hypothetical protein
MREINGPALDRYITGNYGEDQFGPEIPEDAMCPACIDGEALSCTVCKGTGIDPAKAAEWEAQAKAEADAEYNAYLDSLKEIPDAEGN